MTVEHPYFDVNDVLARYNISRWTLQTWIKERGFPEPIRFSNRRRYFKISEVDAWERPRVTREPEPLVDKAIK